MAEIEVVELSGTSTVTPGPASSAPVPEPATGPAQAPPANRWIVASGSVVPPTLGEFWFAGPRGLTDARITVPGVESSS